MADHRDALWIAAVLRHVAPGPSQGLHHLQHDLRDGDGWTQRVVGHHHTGAGLGERRGHKRVVGLVETAPVATMQKHQYRRGRCNANSREQVKGFIGAGAIGHIE